MNNFTFLKIYLSPFKFIRPKFYIGKIRYGTPIFYPRRWIKATPELVHKAVLAEIKREESFNKLNPNHARKIKSYKEIYQQKLNHSFAVPKKIGFDFIDLGWKTKWEADDYRHEWNPLWSFVFFKWQIAIKFIPNVDNSHYWECWLYYSRNTNKNKTTKERIIEAREGFPCVWKSSYGNGKIETICYWDKVLKDKYR